MSHAYSLVIILGLAVITFVCRCFFLWPDREVPIPAWLREGLRYAPLAALAAVIVPEVVMTQGHLIDTVKDARLFGAAAGIAWYLWRRSILGTIFCGTGAMLALRFGMGW